MERNDNRLVRGFQPPQFLGCSCQISAVYSAEGGRFPQTEEKLKLIEQIVIGKWRVAADGLDKPKIHTFLTRQATAAYCVDIQKVYEWDKATSPHQFKKDGGGAEDWPLIRPPFEFMWFEFTHHDATGKIDQGMLVDSRSESDDIEPQSMLVSIFNRAYSETFLMGQSEIWWDENYAYKNASMESPFENQDQKDWMASSIRTLLYALTFFHCKNIETVYKENNRKIAAKFQKKYGIQKPAFHTIEVHFATHRTVSTPSGKSGIKHAQIIRGHFKRFSPEAKLMGKHVGVFFWHPHVRGTIGEPTANDYRVWEPRHRGKCTQ
jgi:hypothetical protein